MSTALSSVLANLAGLAILLAAGAAVFASALFIWTTRVLTRPPRRGYGWAVARGRPGSPDELDDPPTSIETWSLSVRGVEMPVWDLTGALAAGPTVVLTPGWGQGRVGCLDRVQALLPMTRRVVVWDTPGTGEAGGVCTLGALEAVCLLALVQRLRQASPTDDLVLMGASMGAGVSIEVAADLCQQGQPPKAVIAEAPYRVPITPARGVLNAANLPRHLNLPAAIGWVGLRNGRGSKWTGFDRAEHARNLTCPLLVLHGTEDDVCPIDDGRQIAQANPHGRLVEIDGGDHHRLWQDAPWRSQCIQAVREALGV